MGYRTAPLTPPPKRRLDLAALAVRPLVWAFRLVVDFAPALGALAWWALRPDGGGHVRLWDGSWFVVALLGGLAWIVGVGMKIQDGSHHPSWWRLGRAIYRAAGRPVWREEE
jgi:hypothetical protein